MQVIPFHCVFILNGALCGDDVKKTCPALLWIYDRWGRLLRWGLGVVSVVIYHCNAVSVTYGWIEYCFLICKLHPRILSPTHVGVVYFNMFKTSI